MWQRKTTKRKKDGQRGTERRKEEEDRWGGPAAPEAQTQSSRPGLPEQCPAPRKDGGRLRQEELQAAACEAGVDFGKVRPPQSGDRGLEARGDAMPSPCLPQCIRPSWRPLGRTLTSTTTCSCRPSSRAVRLAGAQDWPSVREALGTIPSPGGWGEWMSQVSGRGKGHMALSGSQPGGGPGLHMRSHQVSSRHGPCYAPQREEICHPGHLL